MHYRNGIGVALLLAAVVALTAGCGSSSDDSTSSTSATSGGGSSAGSDGVAEAKKIVAKLSQPVQWESPGPAFDASKAKGKTVWFVPIDLSIPFIQGIVKGMKDGLGTVGANEISCDPKGSAAVEADCIDRAVGQHADAISNSGIESARVAPQYKAAAAAGIPVFPGHTQDPGPVNTNEPNPPVVATAGQCNSCAGTAMADFVVADSDGKAHVTFLGASDSAISKPIEDAFKKEMDRLCPDCEYASKDVPIAQWASSLPTLVPSLLANDPSIDYLVPVFDGMVVPMVPGVHRANAQDKVKIVSFNGSPPVMDLLQKGDVVAADFGGAIVWQGWGFADQAMRIMTGVKPVLDIKVPERMFTRDNIDEIDLKKPESSWYGDVDFEAKYKEMWGVQ